MAKALDSECSLSPLSNVDGVCEWLSTMQPIKYGFMLACVKGQVVALSLPILSCVLSVGVGKEASWLCMLIMCWHVHCTPA
jgi:hypothetical protein